MLRNLFLKTLRDSRWGMLIWGGGLALLLFVSAAEYPVFIASVGAGRELQLAQLSKALQAFSFLTGDFVPIDTLGGFITTRALGFIPLLLGLWAAIVGVGLIRGEEELGALDLVLTTPHSRGAVFAQKAAALGTLIAGAVALLGLGLIGGALVAGESLPAAGLLATLLNIATIVAFWGAVGLLAGQLSATRRTAWAIAGALVVALHLLNNLLDGTASLRGWAALSPVHYYAISKPLAPGHSLEVGAWLVLVAFTALILGAGLALFLRRDLGAAFALVPARPVRGTGGSVALLGSVFSRGLRDAVVPTLAWGLGLGLYGIVGVSTAGAVMEPLRQISKTLPMLTRAVGDLTSNESYIGLGIFNYLPALLAMFAITQVWGWASDEEEGRLEMVMAGPLPRWQVLGARYAAATLSLIGILVLFGACLLGAAGLAAFSLNTGRVVAGLVAAVPLGLVVLAFGLGLAAWLPRPGGAVGITTALVVVMFFLDVLAPVFNLPDAVLNLSIFHLYGRPLTQAIGWGGLLAITLVACALAAWSLIGFGRRDIAH